VERIDAMSIKTACISIVNQVAHVCAVLIQNWEAFILMLATTAAAHNYSIILQLSDTRRG
jgi:hypothetical protein